MRIRYTHTHTYIYNYNTIYLKTINVKQYDIKSSKYYLRFDAKSFIARTHMEFRDNTTFRRKYYSIILKTEEKAANNKQSIQMRGVPAPSRGIQGENNDNITNLFSVRLRGTRAK